MTDNMSSSTITLGNFSNTITITSTDPIINLDSQPKYKYNEGQIISEFKKYIDKTYGQHYMTEEQNIECFDVWLALGDAMPTFRNTAIKYLWRLGKKGSLEDEIKDVQKVMHYCVMILYVLQQKQKNQ